MITPAPACQRCAALAQENDVLRERVRHYMGRAQSFETSATAWARADGLRWQVQGGRLKDPTIWDIALEEARELYLACYGVPSMRALA